MIVVVIDLLFIFFFSLSSLFVMRKVARRIGLVDEPNERKHHSGAVPLVGGISICITLLYFLFNNPNVLSNTMLYASSIVILVIVGAFDDRFDIDYRIRFGIQALLSVLMVFIGEIELRTIGDIFATGEVMTLGWFGSMVTIVAVIGAINAFNMVDGIDGLLGILSVVAFSGIGIMLFQDGKLDKAYLCLVFIIAIIPYIALNLGVFGHARKVFMGDAGSMLIGFTIIWLLLTSSQNSSEPPLRPVTALWLIAVPLMDMAAIMIRRIQRGDSPFKPDREHLHHIFQKLGLSSKQTLVVIALISTVFAFAGIYAEMIGVPEYIMFYLFLACFAVYYLFLKYISKKSKSLRLNSMEL